MKGYVYVLSNPSMPGVYKVGRSVNGGRARAGELYTTGVPTKFDVEFEMLCGDCVVAEQIAHDNLQDCRVSDGREFFKTDLEVVVRAVADAALNEWDLATESPDFLHPEAIKRTVQIAEVVPPLWGEVIQYVDQGALADAGKKVNAAYAERLKAVKRSGDEPDSCAS